MPVANDNLLGTYLKDRRTKLDPTALGLSVMRRRTPGLRREEVAQRANVSATWYTWLEQGRGGAPSAGVLERIAHALMLTDVEREHIFLLALGRPPEVRYRAGEGITPRLQRILDALQYSPAMVKTFTWDIVAWNRAASAVLGDGKPVPEPRNALHRIFCDPDVRARQTDWEHVARLAVGVFRADVARAGASNEVQAFIEELSRLSPEFEAIWRDNDVRSFGEGIKHLKHPAVGVIGLEYSTFAVDGRPDLGLAIYQPVTPEDVERIKTLMDRSLQW